MNALATTSFGAPIATPRTERSGHHQDVARLVDLTRANGPVSCGLYYGAMWARTLASRGTTPVRSGWLAGMCAPAARRNIYAEPTHTSSGERDHEQSHRYPTEHQNRRRCRRGDEDDPFGL